MSRFDLHAEIPHLKLESVQKSSECTELYRTRSARGAKSGQRCVHRVVRDVSEFARDEAVVLVPEFDRMNGDGDVVIVPFVRDAHTVKGSYHFRVQPAHTVLLATSRDHAGKVDIDRHCVRLALFSHAFGDVQIGDWADDTSLLM